MVQPLENIGALEYDILPNPFWASELQSVTVMYTPFAICRQKWCAIMSYMHHSLKCMPTVELYEIKSLQPGRIYGMYFFSALSLRACRDKGNRWPYVDSKAENSTIFAAVWLFWSEICTCGKSCKGAVSSVTVWSVVAWVMEASFTNALPTCPYRFTTRFTDLDLLFLWFKK